MKIYQRIFALWLVLALLLCAPVAAESTEEVAEPDLAAAEIGGLMNQLYGRVDNSDLEVDVVWQKNEKKRVIYSGKLGGYAFGLYRYIDFTGVAYQVIFTTLGVTDDVIYIVPKGDKPIEEVMDSLTANGAEANAPSSGDGLKCEVNLMYDGMYHERILIRDKALAVPIKVTNTGSAARQLACYIGEYAASGALLNMVDCAPIAVGANQSITTTILHGFGGDAEFAKIFVFENGTLRPLTNAIRLTESAADYYANSFADAQEYDIIYPIEGNIDTVGDMDYIRFVPKSSGVHAFSCISANGVLTTLYNANQSALKANASSYTYSLSAGQTYYIGIHAANKTGGYALRIQRKAEASADDFDVYAFDIAANRMKTMIFEQCEALYYDDIDQSKAVYNDLQRLIMEDSQLHRLPEFLQNSDKNINNYDTLVNTYLSLKSADFSALYAKYEALLNQANEYVDGYAASGQQIPKMADIDCPAATAKSPVFQVDENGTVVGEPSADDEMELEVITESTDADETATDRANPSDRYLVIQDKGVLGFSFKVRFPDSSPLNTVYLYNFNTKDGITSWTPVWGTASKPKLDVANGTYSIRDKNIIVPGGVYVIAAMWADRGSNKVGEENTIYRWVQLPYDATEKTDDFESKHVKASFETTGILNYDISDVTRWLGQMDQVYETLQDFTGYTPYNGKPIHLISSREDFSAEQPDGENYWRLIMGWSGNPVKISQPFYQSHMRRLANSKWDWGDTPIHELSHNFDNDKWVFDHETLAFLKLAYVLEKLNAEVYRIDTMKYYKGSAYADFLKTDWFEGYYESFAKGVYMPAGLASILLDIKGKIGWDAFSKTFHHIGELSWSQIPDSELGKLNLFLTCLGQYSGRDVFAMISSRDKNILAQEFGGAIEAYTPPVAELPDGSAGRRVDISVQKGDYKQYQFVPYKTGSYRIYTSRYGGSGVPNDTYIKVYDENTETGTPIAEDDDSGEGKFSRVDLQLTQGHAYYVKVYNYNQDNARLHARLHIMSNETAVKLSLDTPQNVTASYTEFKMFQFTPSKTGTYAFCVDGYNGGQQTYDTYIKLYSDDGLQTMVGQNENKIVAHLAAGKTYYLQFSGYLMRYARGRITVRQGQTVAFTKKTDSSFIYVNSPEYLTRLDIVDDTCHTQPINGNIRIQPYLKIFEQENVTGKNTYYQTHVAWWGDDVAYEPIANFYTDIDFYNPTNSTITVSISNLAYGNEYNLLGNYYNGGGTNVTLSIPAHEHRLLFETLSAPLMMSYPGPPIEENGMDWNRHCSLAILFDLQVNSGNVTISSLAAYNRSNLYLRSGYKNILNSNGQIIDSGEIILDFEDRLNEDDLYRKYKGIAKNQSARIDVDLEAALDDSMASGQPLKVNLKDEQYPNGVANPKTWWMTNTNPLNDQWKGMLYAMPNSLHRFTYHRDIGGIFNFSYNYRNLMDINMNATGSTYINNPVPESILKNVALDVAKGVKEHFGDEESPDVLSCMMGEWGTTYHYTVTVTNDSSSEKNVGFQVRNFDNMIFGYKYPEDQYYVTGFIGKCGNKDEDWMSLQSFRIPPNTTKTFEIVTMLSCGDTGTNNRLVLN